MGPDAQLVGEKAVGLGEGRSGADGCREVVRRWVEGEEVVPWSTNAHCHREGFECRFGDGGEEGAGGSEGVFDDARVVVVAAVFVGVSYALARKRNKRTSRRA